MRSREPEPASHAAGESGGVGSYGYGRYGYGKGYGAYGKYGKYGTYGSSKYTRKKA